MLTKQESKINSKLLGRAQEVTELDRIIQYMISPAGTGELSDREKEIYKRIEFAYDNLQDYPDVEVRNMLRNKFGISQSTAYNDIDTAYFVHGKTGRLRRRLEVYFLKEHAKIALRNAKESRNNIEYIKAIEAMTKVLQLEPEESAIDWSKIQPNNYYLVIHQQSHNESKTLKIDLNKVHDMSTEELELLEQQLIENSNEETLQILEAHG